MAGDLFEVEAAAGANHSVHFFDGCAPVGDVVDDPEVEYGVEGVVGSIDVFGVAGSQSHLVAVIAKTLSGAIDHGGVEVDRCDVGGAELFEDDLRADALAAPDLEHMFTVDGPTETFQEWSLVPSLDGCPHRVVHQGLLYAVHSHRVLLSRGRPGGEWPARRKYGRTC